MKHLQEMSKALQEIIGKAEPSVVAVQSGEARSSGLILDENRVVTAIVPFRERRREDGITVILSDGSERTATVLGLDRSLDLAILALDRPVTVPAREVALPSDLKPGSMVLALGRYGAGDGAAVEATLGMVSAVRGPWQSAAGREVPAWIEVDASLPRGFSGGALVSDSGALLGLNAADIPRFGGTTIPWSVLADTADYVSRHGDVQRGYLGVMTQPVELGSDAETAGQARGLVVVAVENESPSEGKLRVGDILLSVDGNRTSDWRDLLSALAGIRPGSDVQLRILRGGSIVQLSVTLGIPPRWRSDADAGPGHGTKDHGARRRGGHGRWRRW